MQQLGCPNCSNSKGEKRIKEYLDILSEEQKKKD